VGVPVGPILSGVVVALGVRLTVSVRARAAVRMKEAAGFGPTPVPEKAGVLPYVASILRIWQPKAAARSPKKKTR
jgi:hypothetical protein